MGSKRSRSKGGNKSSKWSQTKDSDDSLLSSGGSVVDDSPLRLLCDPWVTTTWPFPFPLPLDPVTPTEEKMEIEPDIVDSDEFNLSPPDSMIELRLRRQEVLPNPIINSMECGHFVDWDHWVDSELQDIEFLNLLKQSRIYGSVLVSCGLNMKKDIARLRRLVRRWNSATHTFFFAWGEAIVTLEDVERILLLPLVSCRRPWPIVLVEGSEGIIEQLYAGYGGHVAPPCNKHSRFAAWVRYFENFEGTLVRRATFVVYWLSCYMLTESPFDHIKAYLFPLAVLLARGESLAVGAMCLSNLYNHLDALHISKMEGSPYYAMVTHLNLALLQVWAWERALPLVTHARSVTVVRKRYPPSPKNNQLDFLQKFSESPPILLKWIGVKSPSLSWVELMDREANFVWRPYVSIIDGFLFALLDEDVEFDVSAYSSLLARTPLWLFPCGPFGSWARYNPHRIRRQFGYDQGVPSENLVVLDHEHSVTSFVLQIGRSCLDKALLLALLPENPRVGVLTRRACRYWNEIAVRFNDYAATGKDECTFPPPPSAPINRSRHMKFSRGLVAYFAKEKIGFVAWHDEATAWVAYTGKVPEPWKKYEPMAKARVFAPSAHGEALNAKPPAKRERPEASVDAYALPLPLPKKVRSSVVAGSRVLPRTVLALRTMKDDALAPLNCAVAMCPLPGPEVSDNRVRPLPSLSLDLRFLTREQRHNTTTSGQGGNGSDTNKGGRTSAKGAEAPEAQR